LALIPSNGSGKSSRLAQGPVYRRRGSGAMPDSLREVVKSVGVRLGLFPQDAAES